MTVIPVHPQNPRLSATRLGRLKPLDRTTPVAFSIRGRTLEQMAREFETPVGTIKRRLHVARNRLKDVPEADGVSPPAGAELVEV